MTDINTCDATFQYKVKNVSKMQGTKVSPPCYIRRLPWKIEVGPMEKNEENGVLEKCLGFFLLCVGEKESTSWRCSAYSELRLLSCKKGQKPYIQSKLCKTFVKVLN